MSYSLFDLPLWELILAVIVIPTAIAIGFQVLVRRWVGIDRLILNNEVAGFIFAIIGVVYAVLLAFVVIAVWEKFSEGQTSVARESAAARALFQYAEGPEGRSRQAPRKSCRLSQAHDREGLACNGGKLRGYGDDRRAECTLPRSHGAQSHRDAKHCGHVGGLYPT